MDSVEGQITYAVALPGCSLDLGRGVEVWRGQQLVATGRVNAKGSYLALGFDRGSARVGDRVFLASHPEKIAAVTYPQAPALASEVQIPASSNRSGERPQVVVIDSTEVNAVSYYHRGVPTIGVTSSLIKVLYAFSYYTACGEMGLIDQALCRTRVLAVASAAGIDYLPPPPDVPFTHRDAVKNRADRLFKQMMTYVLGHEAGHFALGHVRDAYQAMGLDPLGDRVLDIHTLARLGEQRSCELDSDGVAAAYTVSLWGEEGRVAVRYFCLFMGIRETYQGSQDEFLCSHPHWNTRLAYLDRLMGSH